MLLASILMGSSWSRNPPAGSADLAGPEPPNRPGAVVRPRRCVVDIGTTPWPY